MILIRGEMPEWSNGADSKSVVPFEVPRVRIPLSPPINKYRVIDPVLIYCSRLRTLGISVLRIPMHMEVQVP